MSSSTTPDRDPDAVDLPLRLTSLLILLRPLDVWWITPWLLVGAAGALLSSRLRTSPITWAAAAVLIGARIAVVWPLADNHIFLLAYWCLAIAIALW